MKYQFGFIMYCWCKVEIARGVEISSWFTRYGWRKVEVAGDTSLSADLWDWVPRRCRCSPGVLAQGL